MTGSWFGEVLIVFTPTPTACALDFVQTGMSFTLTGTCIGGLNVTGSIDPMTGNFAGMGTTTNGICPNVGITAGTVTMDGRSLSFGATCSGGPFPLLIAVNGWRCGNGIIEADLGEICDDSNHANQDCCSSECVYEPAGSQCVPGDLNGCTDDVCDGAGTCTHPNNSEPCTDGNACTVGDVCVDGDCVTTPAPNGAPCNDFNDCTDQNCQAAVCVPVNKPDGTPCEDDFECTAGETCQAGACPIGPPRVCSACETCNEGDGCVTDEFAVSDCQFGNDSLLQLKNGESDAVRWIWRTDQAVAAEQFGDPVASTPYELCIFDSLAFDPVTHYPRLLFGAALAPGSEWKQTASGFRFKSADKVRVRLKEGDGGTAKVTVRAKGPTHSLSYLPPQDIVLTAYLRTPAGVEPERCFFSNFSPPVTSTDKKYKGLYPSP